MTPLIRCRNEKCRKVISNDTNRRCGGLCVACFMAEPPASIPGFKSTAKEAENRT